jgi:hypothetical protein
MAAHRRRRGLWRVWRLAPCLAAVLLLALPRASIGHDAMAPNAEWFQGLALPNGAPCCSLSDCREALHRVRDGGYEVLIDERFPNGAGVGWVKVPAEAILEHKDNPTGSAVACFYHGAVRCFVRPVEA